MLTPPPTCVNCTLRGFLFRWNLSMPWALFYFFSFLTGDIEHEFFFFVVICLMLFIRCCSQTVLRMCAVNLPNPFAVCHLKFATNIGLYFVLLLPYQIRLHYGGIYRELLKVSVEYLIFGEFMVSYSNIQSVQLKSGPYFNMSYLLRFTTCCITQLTSIYSKCWKWCTFISMHLSTRFHHVPRNFSYHSFIYFVDGASNIYFQNSKFFKETFVYSGRKTSFLNNFPK